MPEGEAPHPALVRTATPGRRGSSRSGSPGPGRLGGTGLPSRPEVWHPRPRLRPDPVRGLRLRVAAPQARLGSVQRLDLALLVEREHDRPLRGRPGRARPRRGVSRRTEVPGELEGLHPVRLETVGPPDLDHMRVVESRFRRPEDDPCSLYLSLRRQDLAPGQESCARASVEMQWESPGWDQPPSAADSR